MGHRHFSNSYNMFRTDQNRDWNHVPAEQSPIPLGMGVGTVNNSSIECPPSNFNADIPHFTPDFPGPPYDHFPHSSAAGNLYIAPDNNIGNPHSGYCYRPTIYDSEGGALHPATANGRVAFKRKSPGVPGTCERGSTSRYYGAGSSSGSSEMQEDPTPDYQYFPSGPIGLTQYRSNSLPVSCEDSSRNVRSRSRLDFESNLSSYHPHPYYLNTHPTNLSPCGPVDLAGLGADATTQERNYIPVSAVHGRFPSSDPNVNSSHEINRLHGGGSCPGTGGYHHDSMPSRYHPVSSQSSREHRNNYSQRAIPSNLGYFHMGHEASSSENGLQPVSEGSSSRNSRPSAGGWRNNYRNGRPRIDFERLHSISCVMDARDRRSENLMMVDRSSFYGEMVLDVDSMSYEELLALGERIGSVCTGLSEDMISKCLTETVYASFDQNHGEGSCAICLEAYKIEEKIATIRNCGHNYHGGCIRKWLSMKNVCPICKADALTETDCSKQQQ